MKVTVALAEKITVTLVSRGMIPEGDAGLHRYGIENGIMVAGNLLASLVFGRISHGKVHLYCTLVARRVSNNDAACGKMKNLALKTTTSCGLRAKIGEKFNQFLPDFIDASARLMTITEYKCKR